MYGIKKPGTIQTAKRKLDKTEKRRAEKEKKKLEKLEKKLEKERKEQQKKEKKEQEKLKKNTTNGDASPLSDNDAVGLPPLPPSEAPPLPPSPAPIPSPRLLTDKSDPQSPSTSSTTSPVATPSTSSDSVVNVDDTKGKEKKGKDSKKGKEKKGKDNKKDKKRKAGEPDFKIGEPILVSDTSANQIATTTQLRPMPPGFLSTLITKGDLEEIYRIDWQPEEISVRNKSGQTALHLACSNAPEWKVPDALKLFQFLVETLHADVNVEDNDSWTPLHNACKCRADPSIISYLVEHGASSKATNNDGTTALHYLVRHRPSSEKQLQGIESALRAMIAGGANINARNKNGETPLHHAAMQSSLPVFNLLTSLGADVSIPTATGDNVMHYAVMMDNVPLVEMLLKMGVDPKSGGGSNGSPYELAKAPKGRKRNEVICGLFKIPLEDKVPLHELLATTDVTAEQIKSLNYKPEEVNEKEPKLGQTPLHLLCARVKPPMDCIEALVSLKAEINALDNENSTPLNLACKRSKGGDIITYLVNHGADVNIANQEGLTPILSFAMRSPSANKMESNAMALDSLLSHGANINAKSLATGSSPLHLACAHGNLQMFKLLLSKGADVRAVNRTGETMLHKAIGALKLDIVEELMSMGMDPRDRGSAAMSPLALAKQVESEVQPQAKEVFEAVKRKATSLDIANMTPEEKREYQRTRTLEELVDTEGEYARDLDIAIRVFLTPVKKRLEEGSPDPPLLTTMQMRKIFGNIEEIAEVSHYMHQQFVACKERKPQMVGRVILDNLPRLQKYERVCTEQQSTEEFLNEALNAKSTKSNKGAVSSDFAAFCEEARQDPDCRKLSIGSFLIKPFQRITKIPLLLRELANYTPEGHPDYPNLEKAREAVNKIVGSANEKTKNVDGLRVLLDIQSRLTWGSARVINLGHNKERAFLEEGDFKISVNREKLIVRHLFFFNDLILVTKPPKKKLYMFLHALPLASCLLLPVNDGQVEGGKAVKNAFSLVHTKEKLGVVVVCKDEAEKAKLSELITENIAQSLKNGGESVDTEHTLMPMVSQKSLDLTEEELNSARSGRRLSVQFNKFGKVTPPTHTSTMLQSASSSTPPGSPSTPAVSSSSSSSSSSSLTADISLSGSPSSSRSFSGSSSPIPALNRAGGSYRLREPERPRNTLALSNGTGTSPAAGRPALPPKPSALSAPKVGPPSPALKKLERILDDREEEIERERHRRLAAHDLAGRRRNTVTAAPPSIHSPPTNPPSSASPSAPPGSVSLIVRRFNAPANTTQET